MGWGWKDKWGCGMTYRKGGRGEEEEEERKERREKGQVM